jgi:hypothetical protein
VRQVPSAKVRKEPMYEKPAGLRQQRLLANCDLCRRESRPFHSTSRFSQNPQQLHPHLSPRVPPLSIIQPSKMLSQLSRASVSILSPPIQLPPWRCESALSACLRPTFLAVLLPANQLARFISALAPSSLSFLDEMLPSR